MSATKQPTPEDLELEKRLQEEGDPDWRSPEYRASRFVWEPDDVIMTPPSEDDWNLTLTDGQTTVLVQTPEQLDRWLHAQGVSLNDLKASPVWVKAPPAIAEALA